MALSWLKMKDKGYRNPVKATCWKSDVGFRIASEKLVSTKETAWFLDEFGEEGGTQFEHLHVDGDAEPLGWLIVNCDHRESDPLEHFSICYDPMSEPMLHRQFAGLPVRVSSVLSFANEYGFLGRRMERLISPPEDQPVATEWSQYGEAIDYWMFQLIHMKALIQIWDAYRDPSPAAMKLLCERIEIAGDIAQLADDFWFSQVDEFRRNYSGVIPELTDESSPNDEQQKSFWTLLEELPPQLEASTKIRMAARLMLRNEVNNQLREGSFAHIDVKDGSPVLLMPRDLLGAMYVHLANELVGKSVPSKQCPACGRYFEPQHGKQTYCNESCKYKGYRQRKKAKEEGNNG